MDQAEESVEASTNQDRLDLFLTHRAEILRYVSLITGDAALAEDVIQETWVRFNTAATAQTVYEPQRFLFRIARNLALDGRRRRSLEEKLFTDDNGEALFVASDEPGVERSAEAASDLAFILAALARLPERTRQAFLLHRVDGMTLVEVGAKLNISKSVAHELVVDAVEHCRTARRRLT